MSVWYDWCYPSSMDVVPSHVQAANRYWREDDVSCKDHNIWRGWAWQAAREKSDYFEVPGWVQVQAHPSCSDPTRSWARLVGIERERFSLEKAERTPEEVMQQPGASMLTALQYLENRAEEAAKTLAWGDPAGG